MRFKMLFLALAGAAVLAAGDGFFPEPLMSLDPIVTSQEATFNPALLGVWTESHGTDLCIIRRSGDVGYTIASVSGSTLLKFEARLFRVGDAQFLDLLPPDDSFRIAAHILARLWIEGDTIRFALLDSDWLKEKASRELSGREVRGVRLLTAPPAAIRVFLARHGVDDQAYSDNNIDTFHRLQ